jgi:hypothetical protein
MDKKKISIQQLKQAAADIADFYGLALSDGFKLVAFYNVGPHKDADTLAALVSGDYSAIPSAAVAVGLSLGVHTLAGDVGQSAAVPVSEKKLVGSVKKNSRKEKSADKENKKSAGEDRGAGTRDTGAAIPGFDNVDISISDIQKIDGDILPAGVAGDGLPNGFADTVEGWLSDWATKYNVELEKCSGLQWRAACIYVGENIKRSGVLHDREREKKEGGTIYHGGRLESLLALWEYFTNTYKHVPLVTDFIAFAGVSRNWFYDYDGRGLTAARVQLAKKAKQIEEAGISAGLVDGRENPTGRIYYSKARLGWQETTTIQHVSVAATPSAPVLPVFDGSAGLLTDSGVQNVDN